MTIRPNAPKPPVLAMMATMSADKVAEAQTSEAKLTQLFASNNLLAKGCIEYSDILSLDQPIQKEVLQKLISSINSVLSAKGLDPINLSDIKDASSFKDAISKYQLATGKLLGQGNGIKKYADGVLGKKTFEAMFPGLVPANSYATSLTADESISKTKVAQLDPPQRIVSEEPMVSGDDQGEIASVPIDIGQLQGRDAMISAPIRIETSVIIVLTENISANGLVDQFIKQGHLNLSQDEKDALIEWFQECNVAFPLKVNDKVLIPTTGQLMAIQEERTERLATAELLKNLPASADSLRTAAISVEVDSSLKLFTVKDGLAPLEPDFILRQILQESENISGAESPVGASGLMQIMPTTARGIAMELKGNPNLSAEEKTVLAAISGAKDKDIKIILKAYPKINIKMGTYYLVQQYNKYDGNKNLALAAYNWGPRRVDNFIKKHGGLAAADKVMEDIAKGIITLGSDKDAIKNLCERKGIPEETGVYIATIRKDALA